MMQLKLLGKDITPINTGDQQKQKGAEFMLVMKRIAVILAIIFVFAPFSNASVKASESTSANVGTVTEGKVYSNATLDDHFVDNCVMVVLSNAASLSKLSYSASDFSEINCKSAVNLTEAKTNKVALKLSGGDAVASRTGSSENAQGVNLDGVNLDTFNQILLLELEETGKDKVLAAIKMLAQRADVLYAGPNYIYSINMDPVTSNENISAYLQETSSRTVTTNDTYAGNQWAINKINLPSAWQITTGVGNSVKVGIIDCGVDASHPDLEDKVTNGIRIYHSGFDNTTGATDDQIGHGTMIAGIIGAKTNNNLGVSGVNWNVDIVSINVYDPSSQPTTASFLAAVNYAESCGVQILSCSLNVNITIDDPCTNEDEELDCCIYHSIKNYDGLIVCSAGNENMDIDDDNDRWLTNYDLDNIIVVGASAEDDTMWYSNNGSASNYGSETVDLFAPGANIYSTMSVDVCPSSHNIYSGYHISNGYHRGSGTSYAVPYVTGVASLIMAKYPNLEPHQVADRILDGVDITDAFIGKCDSHGRLNAYKALHDHTYASAHDYYDETYHFSYCECGVTVFFAHNWVEMEGYSECTDCHTRQYS